MRGGSRQRLRLITIPQREHCAFAPPPLPDPPLRPLVRRGALLRPDAVSKRTDCVEPLCRKIGDEVAGSGLAVRQRSAPTTAQARRTARSEFRPAPDKAVPGRPSVAAAPHNAAAQSSSAAAPSGHSSAPTVVR